MVRVFSGGYALTGAPLALWRKCLLVPLAPVVFVVVVVVVLPILGLTALASIPLSVLAQRRGARQHAGTLLFVHQACALGDDSCEIAWRRFLKSVVEPAVPKGVRPTDLSFMHDERQHDEAIALLKSYRAPRGSRRQALGSCELLRIGAQHGARQNLEPDLRRLYTEWQAGVDVTARVREMFITATADLAQRSA